MGNVRLSREMTYQNQSKSMRAGGRGLALTATLGGLLLVSGAGLGCDSSSMDRDLKRQADRATIRLNQAENERDQLRADAEKSKAAVDLERKRAEEAQKLAGELRQRMSTVEADLLRARQRVRELEEAALAARQGMPTTRAVQP